MRKLILIIGACLALLVAGCGSDDSTTSSSGGEETSSSQQAEAPEKKTKPKVAKPSGAPPAIPPNETLVFVVDLEAVE
jgi:hypothetical protein